MGSRIFANGASAVAASGLKFPVHAERMSCAQITFDGGDVICGVGFVFDAVCCAAGGSIFFVHPGDDANGALGMQAELLAEIGNLHGDGHARGVINCAGAEIPRIEMAADDYELFGMIGTFEVADYVVALRWRESLRSENEMHGDAALLREIGDELRVFGGDGCGGNSGGDAVAGVRKAIIGVAKASD